MPVVIALLRAVNVGGHAVIKMDALRSVFEAQKMKDVQTYVQSGNVVFRCEEDDLAKLRDRLQSAIEKKFRVRPDMILRTTKEMRAVVAKNPFEQRKAIEPAKLNVTFLPAALEKPAKIALQALPLEKEELVPGTSEIYIYFPDGIGKSRFPWAKVNKICGGQGTARNWNTVTKLLEMAERINDTK